jgi:microsomal dipeptidase-like Zn-dependent dipeptidase
LTRKLIERGFSNEQIEKILRGNWLRIFEESLNRYTVEALKRKDA